MKTILLSLFLLGMFSIANAQLKVKTKCPPVSIDYLDGKINGVKPNSPAYDIKAALPCFTSSEEETKTAKCGGGVYYNDIDISIFTERDYVEVGEKFKGHSNLPLMGGKRGTFFKYLGNPKLSDDTWDAFQMSYGTLVLYYNTAKKVRKIQFSTKGTDELSLCE